MPSLLPLSCLMLLSLLGSCAFFLPARPSSSLISRSLFITSSPSLPTSSSALHARKKRPKEQDWMEVLAESGGMEEKEEGIWPAAPAPWEASFVGTSLDPLMLDPDDFDEEELGMMAMLNQEEEEEDLPVLEVEQVLDLSLGNMEYREDEVCKSITV
ncbi:hypothetical protein Naga_101029g2 [Nannochloropsis gaditana]|uniref:Uncharacterized protein n=1 Tax=Nannochloropsis gaditana TaxID=72520 RepID=W7TF19_9STRA|nr:hypothetical protein Naga_101029g2 [Nannochloropsis gaditana]